MAGLLPVDSLYVDILISICRSPEFPGDELFEEISRVLKPGGVILIHLTSQSATGNMITAKKPSWKIGSSFIIKKALTNLPKVHIDDDVDLIDEDTP
ncbi:unnamed protein product [Ilex paraguariensis]|uniref:Methyltransferase type 11 domain-containing protein n=1 Tax=Ilex paraguariensis TaxID=185542 RepID=A0ABC8U910_9AQUA